VGQKGVLHSRALQLAVAHGHPGTPTMEYSYVESNVTEAPYFASKVKLSTEGGRPNCCAACSVSAWKRWTLPSTPSERQSKSCFAFWNVFSAVHRSSQGLLPAACCMDLVIVCVEILQQCGVHALICPANSLSASGIECTISLTPPFNQEQVDHVHGLGWLT